MNERDLTQAMHDVMERSCPPPSMDPSRALDRGRTARRRRRAAWSGAACVPLVVGLGAGPALVANFTGDRSADQLVAGNSTTSPVSTVPPGTRKSGDPWPEGQVDRTATAGPRAERAATLMNDLSSSVPPGFSTPNLKHPDGRPLRGAQGQYASNDGERDYWEYAAAIPVQKGNAVGKLLVQSITPDGKPATHPCKLAQNLWGGTAGTGPCTVMDVGGKKVGVLTTKGRGSFDQWAAYRHDDGTVVYLAQAKSSEHPGRSPLARPVFTARELAALVTSPKFKIST